MPGPKKREAKQHATLAARTLIELSATTAHGDLELAKKQAALARRLMLRYNVRFGWPLRRFYCHGCKELMVPGVNARVRLAKGMVLTTCANCGHVNRKKILPASA
jgi:RNase P subunit RPR2